MVRKKTGDLRLCADYRDVNKITLKDNYPLPLIDDHFDRLSNKYIFSLLDLKSAFYHVDMNEDSIKYTLFVTPMGQYEYLKMPFGLEISPSPFQRFVNEVFSDLIRQEKLAIYVDDLMIATEREILELVFERLVRNKLRLRLDKCRFMESEIQYFGYTISGDGIRPDRA